MKRKPEIRRTVFRGYRSWEDQYLHHEGDPFAYRNDNYTNPGSRRSATILPWATAGSAEFALTTTGEQTVETEIAHGFHYAASIVGGAVVKGGAYVNLDYTSGTGSFQTTAYPRRQDPLGGGGTSVLQHHPERLHPRNKSHGAAGSAPGMSTATPWKSVKRS